LSKINTAIQSVWHKFIWKNFFSNWVKWLQKVKRVIASTNVTRPDRFTPDIIHAGGNTIVWTSKSLSKLLKIVLTLDLKESCLEPSRSAEQLWSDGFFPAVNISVCQLLFLSRACSTYVTIDYSQVKSLITSIAGDGGMRTLGPNFFHSDLWIQDIPWNPGDAWMGSCVFMLHLDGTIWPNDLSEADRLS